METIGNLWHIWLMGVIGSLLYLLWTSWEYFSIIIKGGKYGKSCSKNMGTNNPLRT
jgi:hypothetical protein